MNGRSTASGYDAKVALRQGACNEGGKGDGGLHLEKLIETGATEYVGAVEVESVLVD
jgi:hypothetical protein